MTQSYQGEHAAKSTQRQLVADAGRSRSSMTTPRLLTILAALLLLAAVIFLFFQINVLLADVEYRLNSDASGEGRLRSMNQQMDSLRGKLNNILADSVEIRIKSLEKSIAEGKVSAGDVETFQSLQNDLRTLEDYAFFGGAPLLEEGRLEHPRYQAMGVARMPALSNQAMMAEVARLRQLFYLCLTGLVLGTGVLATRYAWLKRRNPRMLAAPPPKQALLAKVRGSRHR